MNILQQTVDISLWNLDGLGLLSKLKQKGDASLIPLNNDWGPIGRTLIVYNDQLGANRILVLWPSRRIVESIDPKDNRSQVHHEYKEDDFVDMTTYDGLLFVLLRNKKAQEIRQYRVIADRLLMQTSWIVDLPPFTPLSKMAVTSFGVPQTVSYTAYIGPCEGQLLTVTLDPNRPRVEGTTLTLTGLVSSLGREIDFCVDNRNRTLVIADTKNHRIVEVEVDNGRAVVMCGTGQPGDSLEADNPQHAFLNSPKTVAIYRAEELIRPGLLDDRSRSLLQHDARLVKPRTLLIADSGNSRIKKLVQFPLTAVQTENWPKETFLYSFIGSGESEDYSRKSFDKHKHDLRTYPLPVPTDLAISRFGEMLIGCRSARTLILLRPATAKADKVVLQQATVLGYTRS